MAEELLDENQISDKKKPHEIKSIYGKKFKGDIYVEVKQKFRQGKCIGLSLQPAEMEKKQQPVVPHVYTQVSNDIWYQVSKHLAPEDVKDFALINSQTLAITKTKGFWRRLHKRYCDAKRLPDHLQLENIGHYDQDKLRRCCIRALYYCHEPFVQRLIRGYELDFLLGQTLAGCWILKDCHWRVVYQFWRQPCITETRPVERKEPPVSDWEILADAEHIPLPESATAAEKDLTLLEVEFKHFAPVPSRFLHNVLNRHLRLKCARKLLSSNLRDYNLELQFECQTTKMLSNVKHAHKVLKLCVLPWWHPDFHKFDY